MRHHQQTRLTESSKRSKANGRSHSTIENWQNHPISRTWMQNACWLVLPHFTLPTHSMIRERKCCGLSAIIRHNRPQPMGVNSMGRRILASIPSRSSRSKKLLTAHGLSQSPFMPMKHNRWRETCGLTTEHSLILGGRLCRI